MPITEIKAALIETGEDVCRHPLGAAASLVLLMYAVLLIDLL